jgi:hypothetical protein
MALNHPVQGEGFVSAYQISLIPYVTASTVASSATKSHDFSHIVAFFTVKNKGADALAVGFTELGVAGSNRIVLGQNESFSGDFRVKAIFLQGAGTGTSSYELVAGLTGIPSSQMSTLTGSLGYQGVG